jgi:hypothetical protein
VGRLARPTLWQDCDSVMTDAKLPTISTLQAARPCYYLAPTVFAAATRHGIAFLDLLRNRYSGIGCSDSLILAGYVDGLPTHEAWRMDTAESLNDDRRSAALLGSLSRIGILTRDPGARREIVSTSISLDGALTSVGDEINSEASVGPRTIALFLWCLMFSAVSLRVLPIRRVVGNIHRRRVAAIANGYKFNLSRTCRFVSTFRAIRPYFLLPKDKCLLHALTLTRYLAHHHEFPVLVFGVKTDPWGAHAWVQHGDYLLDSNPENICGLEQILGV